MIAVREMLIDDLQQVMVIENANFAVPWTEMGFFSFLIRKDAMFLVAEEGDEIVGYCGLIAVLDEGDITNVAVKQSRQDEGIGKLLVSELIALGRKAGVTTIHLEVRISNEKALSLYQKMGFVQIGVRKNYYENPVEDAITMTRKA